MDLFHGTHDALYDAIRLKRKCKLIDNEWDNCKRLVEEKNIDVNYQQLMRVILRNAEMHEHERERERENDVYMDEEGGCDGKNDPQYVLFLSRLKKHKRSYAVESENNSVPVFIEYEAESGLEDEREQERQRKMRTCSEQIVGLSNLETRLLPIKKGVVVQHGSDMQPQSGDDSSTRGTRALMNLVKRQNVRGRKGGLSTQKPNFRTNGSVQSQHGRHAQVPCSRKSMMGGCEKSIARISLLTENEYEHDYQAQPAEKEKVQSRLKSCKVVKGDHRADVEELIQINERAEPAQPSEKMARGTMKGKNMVKLEHEGNKKTMVQTDNKSFYQDPGPRNKWVTRNYCERVDRVQPCKKDAVHGQRELIKVVQGHNALLNQNNAFGKYDVENEPDDTVKTRIDTDRVHNKISIDKAAKCSLTYKKSEKNNRLKEGNDEIVPEVEIPAAHIKKGILSPFVPSTRFDRSMMDDDFWDPGFPSASDEFRKEVLNVLRKPYDKEERKRLREAIRVGSYLHHHQDLGKKLKQHRYKRGKCLTILRGFFFWLQNLPREGAFQPWNDRQCLAVEPASL